MTYIVHMTPSLEEKITEELKAVSEGLSVFIQPAREDLVIDL